MKKVGNNSVLNSDILFEILSRIPVKQLLGLKCICKEWHRIISSRSFVKAQLENTWLVLTGFIFQQKYMFATKDIKTINYIPVESANKVPKLVLDFLPEQVVVLASCNGLICCRSCLPSSQPQPSIYVCNPVTKEWIQIEFPANYSRNDSIGLAFDLNNTSKLDFIDIFKLVRVKHVKEEEDDEEDEEDEDEVFHMTFEIYSSETGEWKESKEICQCSHSLIKNKGIYIRGILHWLTNGGQVLTFHVENELPLLISVPVPPFDFSCIPETCIGESEGKLHYVHVSEQGIHIWSLDDYRNYNWTLRHWKSLDEIEAAYPHFFFELKERMVPLKDVEMIPWLNPLCFMDGLLLMRVCIASVFLYDIKSGNITRLCSIRDLNTNSFYDPTVIPHCLSLVPLSGA